MQSMVHMLTILSDRTDPCAVSTGKNNV